MLLLLLLLRVIHFCVFASSLHYRVRTREMVCVVVSFGFLLVRPPSTASAATISDAAIARLLRTKTEQRYWHLHAQNRGCWTFEADLRPWLDVAWFNTGEVPRL